MAKTKNKQDNDSVDSRQQQKARKPSQSVPKRRIHKVSEPKIGDIFSPDPLQRSSLAAIARL